MDQNRLILMTRKQAIAYVQERMSQYKTEDRILSEELIMERKDEANE